LGMDRKILIRRQLCHVTLLQDYRSCAWGKKAPALTVSQLRTLLDVVLPLRTYTIEGVLELIAWVQQRNHQAYRAHRVRRQEDG
jgi:hypothetical protein